jgi:TonB family protein
MKTNRIVRIVAYMLMLSIPMSLITLQKVSGNNGSKLSLHKPASEKTALDAELKNKSENLGFWIDPVVISYSKKQEAVESTVGHRIGLVSENSVSTEENKMNNNAFYRSESLPKVANSNDVRWYLQQQIKYPEPAYARRIEGEVIIKFTVNAEGQVTNTHIVKDIGSNCGATAMKAVQRLKFQPAMQNGYAVPCTLQIPVQFKMPE